MKKLYKKFLIVVMIIIGLIFCTTMVNAKTTENLTQAELIQLIEGNSQIDTSTLNLEELVKAYNELSQTYSNEEIANMIDENADQIAETGISKEIISAGTQVLRTTDSNQLKEIINSEDFNVSEIQDKIAEGASPQDAIAQSITTDKSINLAMKLLFANSIFVTSLIICGICFLYKIIIRWKIYNKAGKHGWAALIPIYDTVVYFKVCGYSPWWLLLFFVPVIGWFILGCMMLFAKFRLADAFNKGIFFGFGLLLFGIIFESILAFSKKIKYIGNYEDE